MHCPRARRSVSGEHAHVPSHVVLSTGIVYSVLSRRPETAIALSYGVIANTYSRW